MSEVVDFSLMCSNFINDVRTSSMAFDVVQQPWTTADGISLNAIEIYQC